MRNALVAALVAVLVAGASSALGSTSHILGRGGPTIALDATCKREVVAPPGQSIRMDVNVLGQQIHCLIRRPDPFARCVHKLGPAPVVAKGHTHPDGTSDWSNVDKVAAYLAAVNGCASARLK